MGVTSRVYSGLRSSYCRVCDAGLRDGSRLSSFRAAVLRLIGFEAYLVGLGKELLAEVGEELGLHETTVEPLLFELLVDERVRPFDLFNEPGTPRFLVFL